MFFLDHAWLVPLIPARVVRRDPAVRQAVPAQRLRGRHRRGRRVVRAVVRRARASGSTACRTPTTPTASAARSARSAAASAASAPRAARRRCSPVIHQLTWFQNGGVKLTVGIQIDGLAVMMMFVVTLDLAARARLLARVHARRPPLHALLRGAEPVHRVDAAARRRRQHAADARRLGARRPLLVHADRALVGGEAELRRRAQGVPHHPHRRHRAARRRDHDLLRRRSARPVTARSTSSRSTRPASSPKVGHTLRDVDRARAAARDHRQVGSVPAAHVAARRDGRPDAGVGADPRGHDGRRRRLPRRPALPGVLVRPLDRHARATAASTRWR